MSHAILAIIHFIFRYGQIRPTDSQSQLFEAVKRLTAWLRRVSSTSSEKAATFCCSNAAVQLASGPFSHSGIGELKPTLRRPMRIDSGIRLAIAFRATSLV